MRTAFAMIRHTTALLLVLCDIHHVMMESAKDACVRLAQEQGSGESMTGMNCYPTKADAMQIAVKMCCNNTCCSDAHDMSTPTSVCWAPGTVHTSCSSVNMLAMSNGAYTTTAAAHSGGTSTGCNDQASSTAAAGSQSALNSACGAVYGMYTSKERAQSAATLLGCNGEVHMMGDQWMPGKNMEEGCGDCTGEMAGHSMAMAFSAQELAGEILFTSWKADTPSKYWGSLFGIFLLGIVYEAIKHVGRPLSVRLVRDTPAKGSEDSAAAKRNKWLAHGADTFVYMIQLTLGYFLMLIAMVYNVGLFVAVILGSGVGYVLFAEKKDGRSHKDDDNGGCC